MVLAQGRAGSAWKQGQRRRLAPGTKLTPQQAYEYTINGGDLPPGVTVE
jgi:hypothetical protein